MAIDKWDEEGKYWEDDHGLLDEEQIAKLSRADAHEPLKSPIPTRMISNGEYMPVPQTDQQKQVEARVEELSEMAAKKLGVDRRTFLTSTGGTAAALIAMNEVFGRFFNVDPIEMFEPAAYAQAGAPRDLFVFDDQLHLVRGTNTSSGHSLRAAAQGSTAGEQYAPRADRGVDEGGEAWRTWNPDTRGVADVAGQLPVGAVHQGRLSGQPGDDRAAEQRHGVLGDSGGAAR